MTPVLNFTLDQYNLRLQLRVLLEHLGIALPKQLGHPLVRDATRNQLNEGFILEKANDYSPDG